MAGYFSSWFYDPAYQLYEAAQDRAHYDYTADLSAHMRPQQKCQFLGLGRTCDFFGPLRGNRLTRESFLQGRGHTLSEAPECGVIRLPASLFPAAPARSEDAQMPACQNTSLQAQYTRQPRSCNGLTEVDYSPYTLFPGKYFPGYAGYDAVVGTNVQSRIDATASCGSSPY